MKNITLYYDNDYQFYATKNNLTDAYIQANKDGLYDSFDEWLNHMVVDGWFSVYDAELSTSSNIYEMYYIDESDAIITASELHDIYLENYSSEMSFSEFLNIPSEDKNAIQFYGFDRN